MLCDVLWCHVDIWLVYVGFVYLLKLYVCVYLPMLILCCMSPCMYCWNLKLESNLCDCIFH